MLVADGYGASALRCRDWSFRYRHGSAKENTLNGQTEIGYDVTSGTMNSAFADGSVRTLNAQTRAQICKEYVCLLGKGGTAVKAYTD
mgnify:CR=1 FL=1